MSQRQATVRLSAAGFSPWIPLNAFSSSFGVGLGCVLSSNGNLTYSVQHTFDDFYANRAERQLSRSTTSLTVKHTNHGLSVGSWVQLTAASYSGWNATYAVASVTDQNNYVVTVADAGDAAGNAWVQSARVFDHEDLDDETISADGNYEFPPKACRLIITAYTAGYVDLTVIPGGS